MSAECNVCWKDMSYGPAGVPVCDYCEAIEALNTARSALCEIRAIALDQHGHVWDRVLACTETDPMVREERR